MATSFRLPDDLRRDATAYALRCGISLNALLKLALRTYLDGHTLTPSTAGNAPLTPVVGGNSVAAPLAGNRAERRARKKGKR